MKQASAVAALIALSVFPTAAIAKGGSIGIYAIIDSVSFEGPSANVIRISGVFVVPRASSSGAFQPAQRGYVSFLMPAENEKEIRKEWDELKTAAGTAVWLALGNTGCLIPRMRRAIRTGH